MNAFTLLLVLTIPISWQTTVSHNSLEMEYCKIKPGMTIQQVEGIMGRKPDFSIGSLGLLYLEWHSSEAKLWVCLPWNPTCFDVPPVRDLKSADPFVVIRKGMAEEKRDGHLTD